LSSKKPTKELEKLDLPSDLELPKDIEKILNDPTISRENREKILKTITTIAIRESFSGPLPPPKLLAEYNTVVENGAERIMKMAENQSNHRISLEDHAIKEELRQSRYGQYFGFALGILGMGIAAWLAATGHDTVAGIFGTTTVVGLVTVFVIGKKSK
jgi:uncharacterized membrane protein